jgi:hypothetical protein
MRQLLEQELPYCMRLRDMDRDMILESEPDGLTHQEKN